MALHKKLTLRERDLIGQSLNSDNMSTMSNLVKRALIFTFIVELIGMIIFAISFIPEYGIKDGLFKSIFISVSAFCNSGFDIVGLEGHNVFQTLPLVNIPIMLFAILGGIGFIVFDDIYTKIRFGLKNKYSISKIASTFAIHTKLVIILTIILLVVGFGFVLCAEYANKDTIGNMDIQDKIMTSAFYSSTARSVGFATVDVALFTDVCKIGIILLMLIGGAPGGSAGGIKVTTLGVIILSIIAFLKGKKRVVIFSREISMQTVLKAYIILMLYVIVIITSVALLTITDNNNVLDLTLESVSAIGNVGLTTGLVSDFSDAGKINIMVLMYLGRIGTISMALAFVLTRPKISEKIRYPEGKIIVG